MKSLPLFFLWEPIVVPEKTWNIISMGIAKNRVHMRAYTCALQTYEKEGHIGLQRPYGVLALASTLCWTQKQTDAGVLELVTHAVWRWAAI